MLFRDLQAETVWRDAAAFLRDADAPLPSGAPPLTERTGEADCSTAPPAGTAAE
jgi:hypothetical protein